jgi:hypothetical protein
VVPAHLLDRVKAALANPGPGAGSAGPG